MAAFKEFHIKTKKGWLIQPETICNVNFPLSFCEKASDSTTYYGPVSARKAMKYYKIEGQIEEFEEENTKLVH